MLSRVRLSVTPWTAPCQAPLSMGFSRQEYWSQLPFLPPGDLPDPGIEAASPALAGRFVTTEPPGKPLRIVGKCKRYYFSLARRCLCWSIKLRLAIYVTVFFYKLSLVLFCTSILTNREKLISINYNLLHICI